jgi:hypothetical protein
VLSQIVAGWSILDAVRNKGSEQTNQDAKGEDQAISICELPAR